MKLTFVYKGGKGSGFTSEAGHQGIPGQQGGSRSEGSHGSGTYSNNTYLFHGTATQFVDSIRREGLRRGPFRGVFASKSFSSALAYAKGAAEILARKTGKKILTACLIEVDESYFTASGSAFQSHGNTPPEAIKAIHFYKLSDIQAAQDSTSDTNTDKERYANVKPIKTIVMKESSGNVYVPVVIIDE